MPCKECKPEPFPFVRKTGFRTNNLFYSFLLHNFLFTILLKGGIFLGTKMSDFIYFTYKKSNYITFRGLQSLYLLLYINLGDRFNYKIAFNASYTNVLSCFKIPPSLKIYYNTIIFKFNS